MENVRKFILDTDWYTDCDDCVALRYLVRNLKANKTLLGVNINAPTEFAYASIKAFLQNEKVESPVALDDEGVYLGAARYQKNMASNVCLKNCQAEKSVDFYKRVLEENDEVEILSIGFLSSIEKVYRLYPDLAKRKIKRIWVMGGKWDEQGGLEFNISGGGNKVAIEASRFLINEKLCEMIFLGFEIGVSVITGRSLDKTDILFKALSDYGTPQGRASWDPMLVMAGIADEPRDIFEFVKGTAFIDGLGKNYFREETNGKHCYLVKKKEDKFYEEEIESYL